MYTEEQILNDRKIQLVLRAKCENSLLFFARYFFRYMNNSKYIVKEYIEQIINSLEKTYTSDITRLIINVPPRHGKTQIAAMYIALGIAINPKSKFLYLSYSDSLTLDVSSMVKDIIESPVYKALWGVHLRKDAKAKGKWYTTQGGGVLATSMSGQVTGFGAGIMTDVEQDIEEFMKENFGGAIFIDDPIKPDDAKYSPTVRDKVNNKYISTIRNRKNSPNTPIVLIMQRLHPLDLAGFLLEGNAGDEWQNVVIPIINEKSEPIAPHINTLDDLRAWELADNEDFQTQGMQNPIAARGLSFPVNELNYFENLPNEKPFSILSFADYANKGTDYYSMPIAYMYLNPIRFYIADVIFSDADNDYTIPQTEKKIVEHKINHAAIETNAEGATGFFQIDNFITTNNIPTELYGVRAKANKESRIAQQRSFIKAYFHFKNRKLQERGSEYYKYFSQLTEHKKAGGNDHDDSPDSTAGLSKMARNIFEDIMFSQPT